MTAKIEYNRKTRKYHVRGTRQNPVRKAMRETLLEAIRHEMTLGSIFNPRVYHRNGKD